MHHGGRSAPVEVTLSLLSRAPQRLRHHIQQRAAELFPSSSAADAIDKAAGIGARRPFAGNQPCFMPTALFNATGMPVVVVLETGRRGSIDGASVGVARRSTTTCTVEHVHDLDPEGQGFNVRDATIFVSPLQLQHLGLNDGDICTATPIRHIPVAESATFSVTQPVGCSANYTELMRDYVAPFFLAQPKACVVGERFAIEGPHGVARLETIKTTPPGCVVIGDTTRVKLPVSPAAPPTLISSAASPPHGRSSLQMQQTIRERQPSQEQYISSSPMASVRHVERHQDAFNSHRDQIFPTSCATPAEMGRTSPHRHRRSAFDPLRSAESRSQSSSPTQRKFSGSPSRVSQVHNAASVPFEAVFPSFGGHANRTDPSEMVGHASQAQQRVSDNEIAHRHASWLSARPRSTPMAPASSPFIATDASAAPASQAHGGDGRTPRGRSSSIPSISPITAADRTGPRGGAESQPSEERRTGVFFEDERDLGSHEERWGGRSSRSQSPEHIERLGDVAGTSMDRSTDGHASVAEEWQELESLWYGSVAREALHGYNNETEIAAELDHLQRATKVLVLSHLDIRDYLVHSGCAHTRRNCVLLVLHLPNAVPLHAVSFALEKHEVRVESLWRAKATGSVYVTFTHSSRARAVQAIAEGTLTVVTPAVQEQAAAATLVSLRHTIVEDLCRVREYEFKRWSAMVKRLRPIGQNVPTLRHRRDRIAGLLNAACPWSFDGRTKLEYCLTDQRRSASPAHRTLFKATSTSQNGRPVSSEPNRPQNSSWARQTGDTELLDPSTGRVRRRAPSEIEFDVDNHLAMLREVVTDLRQRKRQAQRRRGESVSSGDATSRITSSSSVDAALSEDAIKAKLEPLFRNMLDVLFVELGSPKADKAVFQPGLQKDSTLRMERRGVVSLADLLDTEAPTEAEMRMRSSSHVSDREKVEVDIVCERMEATLRKLDRIIDFFECVVPTILRPLEVVVSELPRALANHIRVADAVSKERTALSPSRVLRSVIHQQADHSFEESGGDASVEIRREEEARSFAKLLTTANDSIPRVTPAILAFVGLGEGRRGSRSA